MNNAKPPVPWFRHRWVPPLLGTIAALAVWALFFAFWMTPDRFAQMPLLVKGLIVLMVINTIIWPWFIVRRQLRRQSRK